MQTVVSVIDVFDNEWAKPMAHLPIKKGDPIYIKTYDIDKTFICTRVEFWVDDLTSYQLIHVTGKIYEDN